MSESIGLELVFSEDGEQKLEAILIPRMPVSLLSLIGRLSGKQWVCDGDLGDKWSRLVFCSKQFSLVWRKREGRPRGFNFLVFCD